VKTPVIRKIALTVALAIFSTSAAAQSYSCGEWSVSSLSDRGQISVLISPEHLVWSNGRKTNQAVFLKEETLYRVFADQASIYFVWQIGVRLDIRRVFATAYERQNSELHCE
jgi:hypothetical protein